MSPGRFVRSVLGDRAFRAVGLAYRAVFVDLDREIAAIAAEIPPKAHVLDVGGGDGEPLDRLLALRPDIRVTTIDVSPSVGAWIAAAHADRVARVPATTLERYLATGGAVPDVLLACDVVHHIPPDRRAAFFATVAAVFERNSALRLIVKDVEPGHWRAALGYLSDRYITGDRAVSPVSRAALVRAIADSRPGLRWRETSLFDADPPNYALVFEN
jgi:hypothetical protein